MSLTIVAARRIASSSAGSFVARISATTAVVGFSSTPGVSSASYGRDVHVVGLEGDMEAAELAQARADPAEDVALRLEDLDPLETARGREIAVVGREHRRVAREEHGGVRALESGQVVDVRRRGDEERLDLEDVELASGAFRGGSRSCRLRQVDERFAVPLGALADHAKGHDFLQDREAPPLLALLDVGQVHLDDGRGEELDRVADRVAVVRPGARVQDDPVGPAAGLVAPVDVLALVVRLLAPDASARARAPSGRSGSRARCRLSPP